MVFLPDMVLQIKDALASRLSKYPLAEYYGLATSSLRYDPDGKVVTFPSIIELKGASVDVVNFSVKPTFIVYHRALSSTFLPVNSAGQKSYGDGEIVSVRCSTTLRLVCAGNRKDIDVEPEELAMILADALPTGAVANKVKSIAINPSGINYDSRNVFNGEFQGIPYNIGPERFLFSIQYTIEGSYMKGCLKNCDC